MDSDRARLLRNAERLRQSPIVVRIVAATTQERIDGIRQKIRVELSNGWLIDCWEHLAPGHRRYGYHIFNDAGMVTRWDNAPHHPEGGTFPYHQHLDDQTVVDSENMDVGKVLAYLERML